MEVFTAERQTDEIQEVVLLTLNFEKLKAEPYAKSHAPSPRTKVLTGTLSPVVCRATSIFTL